MTSNPNFADYVERVQQNLAAFSLSDQAAKKYLQISDNISNYDPSFIAFAVLFNDPQNDQDDQLKIERKFDPHISDRLIEESTLKSSLKDLKRLYLNRDQRFRGLVDFSNINLEFTGNRSGLGKSTKESLDRIPGEIKELDELYQKLNTLSSDDKETDDDFTDEQKADLGKVKNIIQCLLKRYEVEYVETNFGTTALIYEAWKQGNLVPLGNEEKGDKKFNNLLDALFINVKGKTYPNLIKELSGNLQLENVKNIGDILSNGKPLANVRKGKEWITCIELSLVHKVIVSKVGKDPVATNRYLIYYPLIIDDYWFAGVAYVYADLNLDVGKEGVPEIFNQRKYSKIYNTIKSVGDTLKLSLKEDALSKAEAELKDGKDKQSVFLSVVKDYFVCFDVRRSGQGSRAKASINKHKIYPLDIKAYPENLRERFPDELPDRGIEIYGPEWLLELPEKLALIPKEIEGYESGLRQVPGLYQSLEDLSEKNAEIKSKGSDEQSQKFAHQAAGLMKRLRSNPEVRSSSYQTRVPLWLLNSLVEVWGASDLEPLKQITEDNADFPDWQGESVAEIMKKIVDFSLDHALGRATLQRPGAGSADRAAWQRAFQLLEMENPIHELRQVLDLSSPVCDWPEWSVSRGFILCFYHAFWQAAYHGFRAACGECPSLPGVQNSYVQVIAMGDRVEIRNATISSFTPDNNTPRDGAFFNDLNQRLEGFFRIENPALQDGYWTTQIIKISRIDDGTEALP